MDLPMLVPRVVQRATLSPAAPPLRALQPCAQPSRPLRGASSAPAVAAGFGVGLALGARRGRGAQRRSTAEDAPEDPVKKLQLLLDAALDAEANGQEAAVIEKAEDEAKTVVLFGKNGFNCFGKAEQAPKRQYTDEEFKAEQISGKELLSTEDTVSSLRFRVTSFLSISGASLAIGFPPLRPLVLTLSAAVLVGLSVDLVVSQGALQALIFDSLARVVNGEYAERVVQAESARFLVAYLLGVLPKAYSLSAFEAVSEFVSTSIKSGCVFCNAQLRKEIDKSALSGKSLDRLVCIKLAGVAQEYLLYRRAQSGANNIEEVEDLFKALSFERRRTDDETRWAIINVVRILRRYKKVQEELAQAMKRKASVTECILIIERGAPECEEESAAVVEEESVDA